MTAFLLSLLTNETVLLIGGAVVAAVIAYMRGLVAGGRRANQKQAEEQQRSRDIADDVENDIGALPGGKAREELRKWAKR